jgi:hypothetical protein
MKRISLPHFFWRNINFPLLIFLIFFLNVKLVVKVVALIFILVYSRNIKLGLSWKQSRLPLFYLAMIIVECFKYLLITRNYSLNYALVFCLGILQWTMSLLAIHIVKLHIDKYDSIKTHNTVKAFFALNAFVSLCLLLILLFHPVWLTFWGHEPNLTFNNPSTGDVIMGLSFDTSTVNATLNSIGLIYFLYKRDYLFCLLCILTVVLCTSNLTFLLLLSILVLMVVTVREKKLRLNTIICGVVLTVLYIFGTPKNGEYMRNYFIRLYVVNKNPMQEEISDTEIVHHKSGDSTFITKNTVKTLPDSAYGISYGKFGKAFNTLFSFKEFVKNDTTGYISIPEYVYGTRPGKFISFIQTYFYLKQSLRHFIFGSGIGNFSSKLAFMASGVHALGTYPRKYEYISPDFKYNHFQTYLFYKHSDASKHSVLNFPFAVYNQLLGEYGLTGVILFAVFYLGYFIRRYPRISYGRYLIISLLCFFVMEYWFELFSLVVIFELFILLNIKEGSNPISGASGTPK